MSEKAQSRRAFLTLFAGAAAAILPKRSRAAVPHPDPRPDIDASSVMTDEQLKGWPAKTVEIYNQIREIPQIADGIGCNCGCYVRPNYRSLLTCYYPDGMARGCAICKGEAQLVYRRYKEGQTLDQIRRAIDARFG